MRVRRLVLVLTWLVAGPGAAAGRGGEGLSTLPPAASVARHFTLPPDTARRALRPDSVTTAPVLLLPADDKPTRSVSLRILGAIAFLTVTTLLLYNVRSR
ncbi:hypothetical protein CLV45_4036 [Hymenobacter chitinivorans DSM 11115]|uniref:Uncharacterized protein n=1 Tax=Hymenobacter chitinivorans DSM 11115 TaxID=1121954 RepID=A0A2M9ARJ7_9BACT|nr:hypothetical protein CLV45_4036 [Hymenobacter chitinivorans DSM 11115]